MSTYSEHAMLARDLSVQILDTYYQRVITLNLDVTSSSQLQYIAIMCYIIAFKMTISYSGFIDDFMRVVNQNFVVDKTTLTLHELLILNTIEYDMDPISTPSHIYQLILQLNPQLSHEKRLKRITESTITMCLQNSLYLQFSSSTIAIASMIYSCSMYHIDCNSWLHTLPDAYFHPSSTMNDEYLHQAFDITACVDLISHTVHPMTNIQTPLRPVPSEQSSPTDVTQVALSDFPKPPTLERYESCDLKRRKIEIQDIITPVSQLNQKSLEGCFLFDTIVQSVALCESMELKRKYNYSHEKDNFEPLFRKIGLLF